MDVKEMTPKRISVDWDEEGASNAVLPSPTLLSSSALGLQAIQVQLHR
jgi:hypothetical protein